jgi:Holliday junction resolvase RusA-like endonuclease
MKLEVVVEGKPVPKGSLRRSRNGGLYFPPQVREWEDRVRRACVKAMRENGFPVVGGRCRVSSRFYLTPTKGGKNPGRLRADLDKLVRGVLDAMNGVVFEDDELVVGLIASKLPVEPNGVERADICVSLAEAA